MAKKSDPLTPDQKKAKWRVVGFNHYGYSGSSTSGVQEVID